MKDFFEVCDRTGGGRGRGWAGEERGGQVSSFGLFSEHEVEIGLSDSKREKIPNVTGC